MAIEHRPEPSVYTVKYVDGNGLQQMVDLHASGTADAQEQYEDQFPGTKLVTIWRKK